MIDDFDKILYKIFEENDIINFLSDFPFIIANFIENVIF